jgi:hypothetical protein
MVLNREDKQLADMFDYIILKKGKTIVKNLELIKNPSFVAEQEAKGTHKFLIEKWEKYDGKRAHIVCGLHGGMLKPVHVTSNNNDRKALFQTEYNVVLRFNVEKARINIYENKVVGSEIVGKMIHNLTFDYFYNRDKAIKSYNDEVCDREYGHIIEHVLANINNTDFSYNKPFYAEGY